MDYTLEHFINFCDDMIIANEGLFDKFKKRKRQSDNTVEPEEVDNTRPLSDKAISIIKKYGYNFTTTSGLLTLLSESNERATFRQSDIHILCSEVCDICFEIYDIVIPEILAISTYSPLKS